MSDAAITAETGAPPVSGAQPPPVEFHGPPSAILTWSKTGAELASRRSQALADYWTALASARQPDEAMAAQMDYWSHWIDDYTAATVEALAPFTDQPAQTPAAH